MVELALGRLSGSLQTVVETELKGTIDEFCRRSTAWREHIRSLSIVAGNRQVMCEATSSAQVLGILRVYYRGAALRELSHVPFSETSDSFTGYTVYPTSPNSIYLAQIPATSQSNVINAWVYNRPTDAADFLPNRMTDVFCDFIINGLMARMYAHTNRPYSDQQMALQYQRVFTNDCRKARDMANRGFTPNAQNWSFPSFGR